MNIVEFRDKLNILISQGKGDYKVFNTSEGVYEVEYIEEGIAYKLKEQSPFIDCSTRFDVASEVQDIEKINIENGIRLY